jgi:hypothetical protein
MTALERLIPAPQLTEIDRIDVAAPATDVWDRVRNGELARSRARRLLAAARHLGRREPGGG